MADLKSEHWDDIINLEQTEYEKGKQDGTIDGRCSGFYEDGVQTGFMKSYAISLEIGFLETSCINHLEKCKITERQRRRCESFLQKSSSYPNKNDDNFDFDVSLCELRSLYRSLAIKTGSFIADTKDNLSQQSQAW